MKERLKAVPVVYLFLMKGDEILLALRQNTGYMDGKWDVPAGHMKGNELPTEALIREVREEIGITISPRRIRLAHVSYRPKHNATGHRVDFYFFVEKWRGRIINTEPQKCAELKWFRVDELPRNMTPHVRRALQDAWYDFKFSELGINWIKRRGLYQL